MEKLFVVFLVGVIINAANAASSDEFTAESERFSLELYSKIAGKSSDNVLVSPVSIQTALGLLYQGAEGGTAEEIAAAVHVERDQEAVANSFQELFDRNAESVSVTFVSKLYLEEGVQIKPEFRKVAAEKFKSEVENVDTSNASEAAEKINTWVESKTYNKVHGMVGSDDVKDVQSLLVNTLHFRGTWRRHFSTMNTDEADFWVSETESKKLSMMRQNTYTQFGEFDDFKAVQIPFKYNNFSFVLLVPNARNGVKPLEARFGEPGASLKTILSKLHRRELNVQMPKFKAETKVDLEPSLKDLGLSILFSENADFSRLSPGKVKIDKVIHKAVIDIDEYGIDGTEASGEIPIFTGIRIPPRPFLVDHPFLYFIVDSSGHIFFMGRFVG